MHINEIRKELTREEFLNMLDKNSGCFEHQDEIYDCPEDIVGLINKPKNNDCGSDSCRKCWLKSIENIRFKDEIKINNIINIDKIASKMTREEFLNTYGEGERCPHSFGIDKDICEDGQKTNDECTECLRLAVKNVKFKGELEIEQYKASEIIAMIEDNKLKNDDIIIDKDGDPISIENLNEDTISYLLDYSPFTTQQYIEVPFDEAINALYYQDKTIEVEYEGRTVSFADNAEFSPTIYQIKEGKWRILN